MSQAIIYVEGLIGRLHSLTLGVLRSGTLEEVTANCWQKPWAEQKKRERETDGKRERARGWMSSGSKVVGRSFVFSFQERVDSWDVPQRQTAVPSKAHKPNTLPLLRKEHTHFSIALVLWFTKPSWLETSGIGLVFLRWIIRVCVFSHWLEYYSFKTHQAFAVFTPSWSPSQMLDGRAHLPSPASRANPAWRCCCVLL